MNKLDTLMQTESIHNAVDAMCEVQDAALMQVMTIAGMAKAALWSDTEESRMDVSHVLDAIRHIAASAAARLDTARIEISDARFGNAEAASSPFGHVTPL